MSFELQIFEAERIAHNTFTYDEYDELSHEAHVCEGEVYGKMLAVVADEIANGGSRYAAWCDVILEAKDEVEVLMEYLLNVDPHEDVPAWIQTRGHLEAIRHGVHTMMTSCSFQI